VHLDAYEYLPAILKVYEGCARRIVGDIESATLFKLFRTKKQVSYLSYPEFDRKAHPALAKSETIDLTSLTYRRISYEKYENRPILHRKELFIARSDTRWQLFSDLSTKEEALGLLKNSESIGSEIQWQERLVSHGVTINGHSLSESKV
jgi:DNA phosphorothioation-associated putative methyltransferase